MVLEDSRRSYSYRANAVLKPGSVLSRGRDTWHIVPLVALRLSFRTKICWRGSDMADLYVPIIRKESRVPVGIPVGVWSVG